MTDKNNQDRLEATFKLFFKPGEIAEIRAFGLTGKNPAWQGWGGSKSTISGYFDDSAKFAQAADRLDKLKQASAVYFIFNPCVPGLLARAKNRLIVAKHTTADDQILCHRWLMIDVDPERPAGISATDKEIELAKACFDKIVSFLSEEGWPDPITCLSGNGWHAMYKLPDLDNCKEITELKQKILQSLHHKFGSPDILIDQKVFNASRLTKLYGTWARKGDSIPDRPHRQSYIKNIPEQIQIVTVEQLEAIASLLPAEQPTDSVENKTQAQIYSNNNNLGNNDLGRMDVRAYLNHYGVEVLKTSQKAGSTFFCLQHCVFNPEHKHNEAAIVQASDGKLLYQCFHNSCQGKVWKDARQIISGDDKLAQFCVGYNPDIKPRVKPVPEWVPDALLGVKKGQRTSTMLDLARYYLTKDGLGKVTVLKFITGINERNEPALSCEELEIIVESAGELNKKQEELDKKQEKVKKESTRRQRIAEVFKDVEIWEYPDGTYMYKITYTNDKYSLVNIETLNSCRKMVNKIAECMKISFVPLKAENWCNFVTKCFDNAKTIQIGADESLLLVLYNILRDFIEQHYKNKSSTNYREIDDYYRNCVIRNNKVYFRLDTIIEKYHEDKKILIPNKVMGEMVRRMGAERGETNISFSNKHVKSWNIPLSIIEKTATKTMPDHTD